MSNTPPTHVSSTPSRHSRAAVERYRPFIESVGRNWPSPILINPTPLTTETFACRFRDAVAGIMVYNSAPDLLVAVSQWCQHYAVATVPGVNQLCIGRRDLTRALTQRGKPPVGTVLDAAVGLSGDAINSPTGVVLAAIVTLLEHDILEYATLQNTTEQACITAVAGATKRQIEVIVNGDIITLL